MKDYIEFRIFVCLFIVIAHLVGLLFKDFYSLPDEWVSIGTVLTVIAFFLVIIVVLQWHYAVGKVRNMITARAGAVINPIFAVLLSKWLYVSFHANAYTWPIIVSAAIFFSMPLLGNLIYTGNGRYRSVYFYALGQILVVGAGIWMEMVYFETIKSLL